MGVVVIEPPAPIIRLDEAKRHLRVDHDDDDTYITDLVEVATAWLDGPAGWLGRSLGEQTLEASFDCWPRPLRLPYPPEIEIVSVKYVDPLGVEQSWPVTEPLLYDALPAVRGREGDIRIRYRAGYPTTGDAGAARSMVPAAIRHAILFMVGHLYSNRDAVTTTAAQPATLPMGVEALLAPHRIWSL